MWRTLVDSSSDFIVDSLTFLTNNITHNHGWSIILFTLIFRILILPLTLKSIKSMKAMQELQPKIKEMKEKYKDDREKQAREQMALFKKHGVNPLGGCLPMLLQLPIFILLFRVLRSPELNGYMLVNSSFYGMDLTTAAITKLPDVFLGGLSLTMPGMIDLTFTDIGMLKDTYLYLPTLVLAVVMSVTTVIQQKQMTVDPSQKTMMYMMNIMLIYFALIMPSGVLLYWVFSNVFQITQQKFTPSIIPPGATAGAKKTADTDKKGSGAKQETSKTVKAGIDKAKKQEGTKQAQKTGGATSPAHTGSLKKQTPPAKKRTSSKKRKKRKKKR